VSGTMAQHGGMRGFLLKMGLWVVIGLLLTILARQFRREIPVELSAAILGTLAVTIVLALLLTRILLRTRLYREYTKATGRMTIDWNEAGVRYRDDHGESRYRWNEFEQILDGRLVIALAFTSRIRLIIPKRVLSPSDIADIRSHIRAAGGKA
jgi:uncharacterized protein YacL